MIEFLIWLKYNQSTIYWSIVVTMVLFGGWLVSLFITWCVDQAFDDDDHNMPGGGLTV